MNSELNRYFDEYDLGIDDEEEYEAKARVVSESFEEKMARIGKSLRFAQDLIALFNYFRDPEISWQRKSIIVGALLYFILPLDAIPDLVPFLGYLDDFGVIVAVTKYMSDELKPYYPDVSFDEAA